MYIFYIYVTAVARIAISRIAILHVLSNSRGWMRARTREFQSADKDARSTTMDLVCKRDKFFTQRQRAEKGDIN